MTGVTNRRRSKPASVASRLEQKGIDWLCDQIIEGLSLRQIARDLGISPAAILKWLKADAERQRLYWLARSEQAEALATDIIEIADAPVPLGPDGRMDAAAVADKRARIDARKWAAGKLKPGTYGDKIGLTAQVEVERTPEEIRNRLRALLAKLGVEIPDGIIGRNVGESRHR